MKIGMICECSPSSCQSRLPHAHPPGMKGDENDNKQKKKKMKEKKKKNIISSKNNNNSNNNLISSRTIVEFLKWKNS